MRRSDDRSAVLVIRAWHEPGSSPIEVRARLTQTTDADQPGWEQAAVQGEEQVLAAVGDWLRAFIATTER
jgi:hypothetical protein